MNSINESPDEMSTSSDNGKSISKHWFYEHQIDGKKRWTPFNLIDSQTLEEAFVNRNNPQQQQTVVTDGGRFEVNINERTRNPIYWKDEPTQVRRCSWFYKVDSRYTPYEEAISELLESEYLEALASKEWHRKIDLPNGEQVVFHDANVMVHFQNQSSSDAWGTPVNSIAKPRIVKRGTDEFQIDAGDSDQVDHLLFMVHGIGSVCDLKMRTVEEVVDEFRSIAQQLVQAHYQSAYIDGKIGRVEVLPVSWYKALHSDDSGIDQKLKSITLDSIPRLRNFTNETLLDVLFYTSPIFSQGIINTVANSLNKKYSMFLKRNKNFRGRVSLAGHSLGSLILFDLLCHQNPSEVNGENLENPDEPSTPIGRNKKISIHHPVQRTSSKPIDYHFGLSGTGQPMMKYPQLIFEPMHFFALGSPIGMFVTIRGIDKLGLDFRLPTCDYFFNIFHPFDPVAYRIEALVNPDLATVNPVLIPHHKGRKRMHLELKETLQQVSADLKTKLMSSVKNVTDTVCALNPLNKNVNQRAIEKEVAQVLNKQLSEEGVAEKPESPKESPTDNQLNLGLLNQYRRFDYVLQEAPLEFFNEYLFALASHMTYWDSADTILFIVKEIYSSMNIEADKEIPQHSLKIERPSSSTDLMVASSANLHG